jgi:hypothetical protein
MEMIRICQGTTRIVLVVGPYALKFARHGDIGRRCNRYEAKIWKLNRDNAVRGPRLCPVLWSSSGGAVLLMPAAEPLPADMELPEDWADWWLDTAKAGDDFPGEHKAADWGMLNGRIVLLDYSSPVA